MLILARRCEVSLRVADKLIVCNFGGTMEVIMGLPKETNMQQMHDTPPVIMVAKRIHRLPHRSITYQPTKYEGISTAALMKKPRWLKKINFDN